MRRRESIDHLASVARARGHGELAEWMLTGRSQTPGRSALGIAEQFFFEVERIGQNVMGRRCRRFRARFVEVSLRR